MASSSEWQGRVGQNWAHEWRRTDRSFTVLTERLLQRSRDVSFSNVLDIGCGAGELSLALARGRRQTNVLGVDISPQLIDVAKERAGHLTNVSFECADAQTWRPEGGFAPDLLVSRHGVMFFDDSSVAFANLAACAARGANLLFSCFRKTSDNPFFADVSRLLPMQEEPLGDDEPGPFRFGDAVKTKAMLEASGWCDVSFEPFDFAMIAGGGEDPVSEAVAYYTSIGPASRAANGLSESERAEFELSLRDFAKDHLSEGIVSLRAGVWLVSGRRA